MKHVFGIFILATLIGYQPVQALSFDIYAIQPDNVAQGKTILLTAHVSLALGAQDAQVPAGVPLRAIVSAVLNAAERPTGSYRIHRLLIDDEDPRTITDFLAGSEPTFEPDATVVARGYMLSQQRDTVSWYSFRTGMQFRNSAEAQQFTITDFLASVSRNKYLKGTGLASRGAIEFGRVAISDQNIPELAAVAGYAGAYVVIYAPAGEARVFRESQFTYTLPSDRDPIFQDGGLIEVRTPGALLDGVLYAVYDRGLGVDMSVKVPWSDGVPVTSLPAAYQDRLVGIVGGVASPVVLRLDAPDRTDAAATLYAAATASRDAPTPEQLASVSGVEVGLVESGAFTMVAGILTPVVGTTGNQDSFPSAETMLVRMQAERNAQLYQATPALANQDGDAVGADAQNLQAAIIQVEREMAREQPSTQPLRQAVGYRKSTMLAAGIKPYYTQGSPNPGDGDNPPEPRPAGVAPTGAPAYDLDGDGDLDRFNTADPFPGSLVWLRLAWNIRKDDFRLGDYDSNKCRFAAYGVDAKGKETLLLVGRDRNIYRHRQHWTGRTYYKFGLKSLLDPTDVPGEYEFALAYRGDNNADSNGGAGFDSEALANAIIKTAVGGTQQTMTLPSGQTVEGPLVSWTETAELYPQYVSEEFITPEDLAVAIYSDPSFEPRTTDGKPYAGAKYTRVTTTYRIIDFEFVPGEPVVEEVYFPNYFRPDFLVDEAVPPEPAAGHSFLWGYDSKRTNRWNMPWNYHYDWQSNKRGWNVYLNEPKTLKLFGESEPAISVNGIAMSEGKEIRFRLRERPDPDPLLTPDMDAAAIDAATTVWQMGRSMYHAIYDARTDLRHNRTIVQPVGNRLYEILEGIGYYIFKGRKRDYASVHEQLALLRSMWAWSTWQPPTVFKILHLDDDETKPLLNTARAQVGDGTDIAGVMRAEVSQGGSDMTRHVQRREDLIHRKVLFFSAARGREWEIEYALETPEETVLYCTEYESQGEVESIFSARGRELIFLANKDEEWRAINDCNERIFGRTHVVSRINKNEQYGNNGTTNWVNGSPTVEVFGDAKYLTKSRRDGVVFSDQDMIYDKPGCHVGRVALLPDGQYGDPQSSQWFNDWKIEYRHPMIIFYDDRVSSVVVAYGENANPRLWVPLWDSYHTPVEAEALGYDSAQRERFESWSSSERLVALYDTLHAERYEEAVRGNITIAQAPAVVVKPVAPVAPTGWKGGSLVPPAVVEDPGPLPIAAPPIWTRTLAAWSEDQALGGTMGTSRSPVSALRLPWSHQFPLSENLQGDHDAWITQLDGVEWDKPGQWLQWEGDTYAYVGNTQLDFQWNNDPKTLHWGAHFVRKPAYRNRRFEFTYAGTCYRDRTQWIISGPRDYARAAQASPAEFGRLISATPRPTYLPDSRNMVFSRSRTDYREREPGLYKLDNFHVEVQRTHGNGRQTHQVRGMLANGATSAAPSNWSTITLDTVFAIYPFDAQYIRRAKTIANADLIAYREHLDRVQQWPQLVAQYENYVIARTAHGNRMDQYSAWLPQQAAAQEAYQAALITHQQRKQDHEKYVQDRDVWQSTNSALLALRAGWDAYVQGRDAWVYLVGIEIEEPGVAWHVGDPIFAAFEPWAVHYDL